MVRVHWLWLSMLMLINLTVARAQQTKFVASADANQVLLGSYVIVTFTLQNGKGSQFKAPSFKDFKVINGPNQSVQTTIINGAMSSEMAFSYSLQPQRQGRLTIGPAFITVQRKELATEPITIEVIPPSQNQNTPKSAAEGYYVQLEASTARAYVGQQIVLDYKLYTTVDIGSFEIRSEPKIDNCFTLELPTFHLSTQREIIGGKEYVTKVIKRVAVFPQQSGSVQIDPAIIALGITYEDPNSMSFFFRNKVRLENVQTNTLALSFLPLPPGAPLTFSGAVGSFNADFSVSQSSIHANSTLALRLRIQGDGDEKKVAAPVLELPTSVELYDPRQVAHTDDNVPGKYRYTREYEYLLVPQQSGELTLTPSFSYFDPINEVYQTITDTLVLTILPGTGKAAATIDRSSDDQFNAALDMRAPAMRKQMPGWGSWLHGLLMLLPLMTGIFAWFYRRKINQSAQEDRLFGRQRRARAVAADRLALAKKYLDDRQFRAYYDELLKACSGYIADKFSVPPSDLSKHRIMQVLQDKKVPTNTTQDLAEVWAHCEMALFSGNNAGSPKDGAIYETGVKVLSELETFVSGQA